MTTKLKKSKYIFRVNVRKHHAIGIWETHLCSAIADTEQEARNKVIDECQASKYDTRGMDLISREEL